MPRGAAQTQACSRQQPEPYHLLLGGGKSYLPIKASLQGQEGRVPMNTECSGRQQAEQRDTCPRAMRQEKFALHQVGAGWPKLPHGEQDPACFNFICPKMRHLRSDDRRGRQPVWCGSPAGKASSGRADGGPGACRSPGGVHPAWSNGSRLEAFSILLNPKAETTQVSWFLCSVLLSLRHVMIYSQVGLMYTIKAFIL